MTGPTINQCNNCTGSTSDAATVSEMEIVRSGSMIPADKLEAILPADGVYTKDQRIIAEAVAEMRGFSVQTEELRRDFGALADREMHERKTAFLWRDFACQRGDTIQRLQDKLSNMGGLHRSQQVLMCALAFALGIALALVGSAVL